MEQLVVKGVKDFSKDQFGRTQVTSAEDMANVRYQNFFLIHHSLCGLSGMSCGRH